MAKGFKKGVGGANPLNFKVVGGTNEPTTPKENTIWVNTDTEITSWFFSANEPSAPSEGMVWFFTGTSSPSQFNALKKNGIAVCPLSAKQYVSGAWVDKTAKTYQGGALVDWGIYLYNKGDFCEELTGGWEATTYSRTAGHVKTAPTVTVGESDITLQMGGMFWDSGKNNHCSGTYFTVDPVDITGRKNLKIKVTAFTGGGLERDVGYLGVTSAKMDSFEKLAEVSFNTVGEATLDVSQISGEVFPYIALDIPSNALSLTFDSIYMG